MDYSLLTAAEIPPIVTGEVRRPSPLNPLGAKGAGEGGAVGTLPAVANAVADALGRHLDPPFTRRPGVARAGGGRHGRRGSGPDGRRRREPGARLSPAPGHRPPRRCFTRYACVGHAIAGRAVLGRLAPRPAHRGCRRGAVRRIGRRRR